MLGKLLKYDLKSLFKFLAIFYLLAIFFSGLTRILFNIEGSLFWNVMAQIASGTTIAMIINILINNLMRLWVYFKNNLYGDESYLTHTLPVRRSDLYLAKFLLGLITTLTSTLVILVTVLIAWYSLENFEALKNFLAPLAQLLDSSAVKIILVAIGIIFLEFFSMLVSGYLGIILGHRRLANRTAWSVGLGFLVYLATQIIVLVGILALGAFDAEVGNLIFASGYAEIGVRALKMLLAVAGALYLGLIVVNYLISQKVFKKIDVE